MTLKNCWEFHDCGRGVGGEKEDELGVCPAATHTSLDGLNRGKNAGRICWVVAGTVYDGDVQGTFAKNKVACMTCDFFKHVKREEGFGNFTFKPSASANDSRDAPPRLR